MDFSFAHANSSQEIPSDEMTQNMSMLGRHLGPQGGRWGGGGGGGGGSKGGQRAAEGQRSELKRVCLEGGNSSKSSLNKTPLSLSSLFYCLPLYLSLILAHAHTHLPRTGGNS